MKLFSTFFLITITSALFAQLSGNIGIGYNKFANNYNDYKRTNGLTLAFHLEKELTDLFNLSYGIDLSVAHENYIEYYYPRRIDVQTGEFIYDFSKIVTDKSNNYSLSIQYPVNLITTLITDKLYLVSGISLNIDNFLIFGDAIFGNDPEASPPKTPNDYYLHDWPVKALGFGHQIGLIYKPLNKIGIYGVWKSTQNKTFGFSYIDLGIQFNIITNR